jgi:hypothetical protein
MVRPMLAALLPHPVLTIPQFWYALGIVVGMISGISIGISIGRELHKRHIA